MSGATPLRAGYQKLLEDARAARFDVIVAEALDRLSRDQEDIAGLYKQLCFADIKLITLAEGEISELHVGLKGTMNALFLKDLAAKTRRGLEGRVRQGRSGGGLCYGYDVVKEVDGNGEAVHGGRRINEGEARVVRRIFAAFAAGKSPRAIARELNAERLPGPGGRHWSDTTIRGHHVRRTGILRNDLYVGSLVWNRQRFIKDPATGKRVARMNPESEWIVHDVPHLRIVDQDVWEKARARFDAIRQSPSVKKVRETRFWEQRRAKHLLTGIATCGVCGGKLASVGRDYLACGVARRQGICHNRRGIQRGALEGIILDALKSRLMQPDLVEEFIASFHAEANRLNHTRELQLQAKGKELEDVARKLDGLIDAIAEGLRSDGLQAKLESLERRKRDLEGELAEAPPPAPRFHPNLAELYRRKVEKLHEALSEPSIRQEAVEILRSLIDVVVLKPVDRGFEIELVGDITKMIELPEGSSDLRSHASSVKVVAGARNRL